MRLIYLILFSLYTATTIAQSLTVSDIDRLLQKKSWSDVDEYLSANDWDFFDSKKGVPESTINWTYQRNSFNDKAVGWFTLYLKYDELGKILLQVPESQYLLIEKGIKRLNYKATGEEIIDNGVKKVYSGDNLVVVLVKARVKLENDFNEYGYNFYINFIKKGGPYDDLNGLKKEFIEDGYLIGNLKNGVFEGVVKEYDFTTRLIAVYNYKFGQKDGEYTVFFYEGNSTVPNAKRVGTLRNGIRNGIDDFFVIRDGKEYHLVKETYENGIKNGPFILILGDTLIKGSYKNDMLHGKYQKYQDFTSYMIGGTPDINRIDDYDLVIDGGYLNDKKNGRWRVLTNTSDILQEVYFLEGKKEGSYKFYYPKVTNMETKEPMPYSEKLYKIEEYKNDQLDGKVISYSYFDRLPTDCPPNSEKDYCYEDVWIQEYSIKQYKNGVINGFYFLLSESKDTLERGNFIDGERDGFWVEQDLISKLFGSDNRYEGKYVHGKRIGTWLRKDSNSIVLERMEYKDGNLKTKKTYDNEGNELYFSRYNDKNRIDYLKIVPNNYEIDVRSSASTTDDNTIFDINLTFSKDGFKEKYELMYTSQLEMIIPSQLKAEVVRFVANGNSERLLKDGKYFKYKLSNYSQANPSVIGHYSRDQKTYEWEYYYYEQSLKKVILYKDSKEDIIFISDLNDKKHNGEFREESSSTYTIYKVNNGFYHGRAETYNSLTNEVIKKEKYKDGVLQ